MPTYKSYLFRTKDPVIDALRTFIQIHAVLGNLKFGKALQQISNDSGVKTQTLRNWFYGTTISPRHCCVAAVVNAIGAKIQIGKRYDKEGKAQ